MVVVSQLEASRKAKVLAGRLENAVQCVPYSPVISYAVDGSETAGCRYRELPGPIKMWFIQYAIPSWKSQNDFSSLLIPVLSIYFYISCYMMS